eukprot:4448083-Amphidinium_carterae.1
MSLDLSIREGKPGSVHVEILPVPEIRKGSWRSPSMGNQVPDLKKKDRRNVDGNKTVPRSVCSRGRRS